MSTRNPPVAKAPPAQTLLAVGRAQEVATAAQPARNLLVHSRLAIGIQTTLVLHPTSGHPTAKTRLKPKAKLKAVARLATP